MKLSDRTLVRAACIVGLFGALCGILGDYFLTFSSAVPGATPYIWEDVLALVRVIPHHNLAAGHYFGVFGMQLSIFGFWAVCQGMRPAGRIWWIPGLLVMLFIYFVGCGYHGQLALLGSSLQMTDGLGVATDPNALTMITEHHTLMWKQLTVVEVGIVLLSIWLPVVVLCRKTVFPKWFAICSPAPWMVVFALLSWLGPDPLRMFVELTVFNVVAFLLIAVATVLLWNIDPITDPDIA